MADLLKRWSRGAAVALATLVLSACPEGTVDPDPDPEPDPLTIETTSLPDAVVGEVYAEGIDAEGGDGEYDWTLIGSLPPGLSFDVDDIVDNDALITGTPTTEGVFNFSVRVEDGEGETRTRNLSIEVLGEPPPLAITTVALGPGLVGTSYDAPLRASGGDGSFTWSIASGTLPSGLSLTATGRVQGSPSAPDTAIVVFRVQSAGFQAERALTVQVVANRTGTYDITVAPVVPVPASIQPHLDAAVARWQAAITGDLSAASIPVSFFGASACGGFGTILNGTAADDMIILVNITSIDGPGQVLGQAGPCVIRNSNDLPFAGILTLDADDLASLTADHVVDLIVHEMGHVLGFGSLWDLFGLLTASTSDPRFTGASAVAEWNALGGAGQVPAEDQGGEGTARSHWRETIFNTELMTGFAEGGNVNQPLSRVSIASLADMGYTVNLSAADAFSLAPPLFGTAAREDALLSGGYDLVYDGPIYRMGPDGTATLVGGAQ